VDVFVLLFHSVALNHLSRPEVLWDDEEFDAMAEGRKIEGPIDWDKILKPVDPNVIQEDEEVKTYTAAIEKAVCPMHNTKRNVFAFFDDVTLTSDGEKIKHHGIALAQS